MIIKWEINYTDKFDKFISIEPVIKWDSNSTKSRGGLSSIEYETCIWWRIFPNEDEAGFPAKIRYIRQIDILEAEFPAADVSELRKVAKELDLPW